MPGQQPEPGAGPPQQAGPPLRTVFWYGMVAALGALTVFIAVVAVYAVRALLVQVGIAAFIALSLDPAVRWMIR